VIAGALASAAIMAAIVAIRSAAQPAVVVVPAVQPDVTSPPSLGRRDRRRRAAARHAEVPQLLDLLAAGSTAGLSAELSFREAVSCLRGPLARDLEGMLLRVDLGAPWREELARYVEETGDPDLARTMMVLSRTERLGVSLRDATRDLAATVRDANRSRVLERARSAPVKMLFPLVFLILPAFLLLTVVPVLITTVRSI
jgi:tight adherence protein C